MSSSKDQPEFDEEDEEEVEEIVEEVVEEVVEEEIVADEEEESDVSVIDEGKSVEEMAQEPEAIPNVPEIPVEARIEETGDKKPSTPKKEEPTAEILVEVKVEEEVAQNETKSASDSSSSSSSSSTSTSTVSSTSKQKIAEREEVESAPDHDKLSISKYFRDFDIDEKNLLHEKEEENDKHQQSNAKFSKEQEEAFRKQFLRQNQSNSDNSFSELLFSSPIFLNKIFSSCVRDGRQILDLTYVCSSWRRFFVASPGEFYARSLSDDDHIDDAKSEASKMEETPIGSEGTMTISTISEGGTTRRKVRRRVKKIITKKLVRGNPPVVNQSDDPAINIAENETKVNEAVTSSSSTPQINEQENSNNNAELVVPSTATTKLRKLIYPQTSQIWKSAMGYHYNPNIVSSSFSLASFACVDAAWAIRKSIEIGGAKIKSRGGVADRALQVAVERQNIDSVRVLTEVGGVNVLAYKASALIRAAELNNVEILKILLSSTRELAQGRANIPSWFGETQIIAASRRGSSEAVDVLLENSARVKKQNFFKKNAIDATEMAKFPEIVLKLSIAAEKETSLNVSPQAGGSDDGRKKHKNKTKGQETDSDDDDDASSFEDFMDEEAPPPPPEEENEEEEEEEDATSKEL